VNLWAVRWYLMFPVSYRDLALMLQDRGVEADHTTIFRWIQTYANDRAVDSRGQTIDFLLSAKRDAEAAKRFSRKALGTEVSQPWAELIAQQPEQAKHRIERYVDKLRSGGRRRGSLEAQRRSRRGASWPW